MNLILVPVMQEKTIMGNKKNGYSDSEMQLAPTKNFTKASENNGSPSPGKRGNKDAQSG